MTKRKNPRQTQPEFFYAGGPGHTPIHPIHRPLGRRNPINQVEFLMPRTGQVDPWRVSRQTADGSGWR